MRTRFWIRTAIQVFGLLAAVSAVAFMSLSTRDAHLSTKVAAMRYRITATVELLGKTISASAIQQLTAEVSESFLPNERGLRITWRGEAPLLDLGDSGVLVVLMSSRRGGGGFGINILESCGLGPRGRSPLEQVEEIARFSGSCEVDVDRSPMIVWLPEPLNPHLMTRVDPEHPDEVLGIGTRWLGIELETTDEAVSADLRERLPWLLRETPAGTQPYKVEARPRPIEIGGTEFIRGNR